MRTRRVAEGGPETVEWVVRKGLKFGVLYLK